MTMQTFELLVVEKTIDHFFIAPVNPFSADFLLYSVTRVKTKI